MALVKFGNGVSGLSGKIAGTVYARNKSGAYARNWAVPVNPGTVSQSKARGQMSSAASMWSKLSYLQIQAWNAYASVLIRTNRNGEQYTPSGRQIFTETFINLNTAQLPPLEYPSGVINTPSLQSFVIATAEVDAGDRLFTILETVAGAPTIPSGEAAVDCRIQYYATPTHPYTRKNVNTSRRLVLEDDAATLTLDWFASYNAVFGEGSRPEQLVDVWARIIDTGSGFASFYYKATKVTALA